MRVFEPNTEQSKTKPINIKIIFETQMKIAPY